tara:strand:+ start:288 stop:1190 length:903 start_codon:yes stop_codon:yes gene_type:complete
MPKIGRWSQEWRIVAICVNEDNPLIEPNPSASIFSGPNRFFSTMYNDAYLIRNLANRDIKSRYSRALIGFGWTFLEPLLLSIVYYALFTIIAGRPEPLYALHVITGVIIWGHFGKSLQASVASLTKGKNLIKQVYFPREILAISPVIAQFWISCTSLLAVIPIMIYLNVKPTVQLLWMVPLGMLLSTILAIGVGMLVAPLNAISQDVQHLFRFIVRAGFFVSPVMWTYEMAAERASGPWLDLIMLNPMVVPITLVRKGLDGSELIIATNQIGYSFGFAFVTLFVGVSIFKYFEAKVVKYL